MFWDTLEYFKKCLQKWVKGYLSQDSCQKHFTFMHTPGSLKMDQRLETDVYAFWEALYLYNEMGNFLWINQAELVTKLSEDKLKKCFFYGQPKDGRSNSGRVQKPHDQRTCHLKISKSTFELKKHSIRSQQHNTAKQHAESLTKHQAYEHEDNRSNHWKKKEDSLTQTYPSLISKMMTFAQSMRLKMLNCTHGVNVL